jgi:hypothetical protein
MIAFFASDLLWATRIKGVALDLGIEARPVRTVEMLEARLAEGAVRGLIVDLDASETALALIRRVREWQAAHAEPGKPPTEPVRVVAFGPHVETAVLEEARRAGASRVMTRGAFSSRLAEVVEEAGGSGTS